MLSLYNAPINIIDWFIAENSIYKFPLLLIG